MHKYLRFFWSVLLPVIAIAVFMVAIGVVIKRNEDELSLRDSLEHAQIAASRMEDSVDRVDLPMKSIRSLYLASTEVTPDEFTEFTDALYGSMPEFLLLKFIGKDFAVNGIYPKSGLNAGLLGARVTPGSHEEKMIEAARAAGVMTADEPQMIAQGYPAIDVYLPVIKEGAYLGTLVGRIKLPELFADSAEYLSENVEHVGHVEAVVFTGDLIVSVNGYALYNTRGERVLRSQGALMTEFGAPNLADFDDRLDRRFFVADREWFIKIMENDTAGRTGFMGKYVFFSSAVLLMIVVFLSLLYRQRRRLEIITAREREFVSLISHQLRLPLTHMSWGLETALTVKRLPKEAKETLVEILGVATRSAKLVSDILNISRIDRGVMKTESREIEITKLLDEVLAPVKKTAEEAGVRLVVEDIGPLSVCCDPIKIEEAIRNIVDNAVRYSRDGGTPVVLSVEKPKDKGKVVIKVSDQGPGIPEEKRHAVFEKSAAGSGKGAAEGAGLGLFLSRSFIEMSDGKVYFETSSEGTTFFVELPMLCD